MELFGIVFGFACIKCSQVLTKSYKEIPKCYQALDKKDGDGELAALADPDFKLAVTVSGALDWTIINCPITTGGEQNMVASKK